MGNERAEASKEAALKPDKAPKLIQLVVHHNG
jgi:hypothetical protein